jgi:hypothetical protein
MIPIVAGLLMGAAMGGGIAALQKKDILQGALMGAAGGALGGAFMPGVAGAAVGEGVGSTASALGNVSATELANQGILNTAGNLTPTGAAQFMGSNAGFQATPGITDGVTGAISSGNIPVPPVAPSSGVGNLFSGGIGDFLTKNKYALAGGAVGGMMAPGQEPEPADQGNIYTTQFSQEQNPNFGAPGEDYFSKQAYAPGTITPVKDYKPTQFAANGGIIALAEGGGLETQRYSQPTRQVAPEVAAYNAQMMERANQQYNVNPRPGPMQVPGSVGYVAPTRRMAAPAPTGDSVSGLRFNPITQQFEGEFNAPGTKKKSDYDSMQEELDQMKAEKSGYNFASGDSGDGGMAYGGAVGYNQGGGLSSLGSYSDGGQLLKGPGDGVSDSIPARIGRRQPARLADGEFVVPARVVSELGNGSTDAGAKQLYAMMDRVQNNRKKSIGKGKVAVDAKSRKHLPA